MENNEIYEKLSEKYPFLTVVRCSGQDIVCIIQNRDALMTTVYDFGALPNKEMKELFLYLGDEWWWESNREVGIGIFLREEWKIFLPYARTFTNKTFEIIIGPCPSLNEIAHKKKKRKSITLVKKLD